MPLTKFYFKQPCPYCQKVFDYMKENFIDLPLRDINKKLEFRSELKELGGKMQVPCLIVDNQAIFESDKIIQWLKDHKSEL